MHRLKLLPALAIVATAAVLAGCGSSSSGVSAASYVKSVCNAVVPFKNDLETRGSALNFSSAKSIADIKTGLQGFMAAIVSDSDKAVSALKSAGTPNVSNGSKIASTLVSAFTQIKSAFVKAQGQVNNLQTSSLPAFEAGAQSVVVTIRSSVSGLGPSLNGLKSPDLEKAAAKEPACKAITG